MKVLLTLAISGAALLAQTPPPATKAAPKTGAPAAAKSGTTAAKKGTAAPRAAAGLSNPALAKATAPELFRAKFTTTKGDFVIEVNRSWAPVGADRFYNLVRVGYFTNASFFRVIPNFIVQFGMHADPKINDIWDKARIKDDPVKQGNKRGTIVYAKPDMPNARTTQFFINLKDNSASLDGLGFAAFGTITEGMDIVDKIYSGYGEGGDMGGKGPTQARIGKEGKAYLDKSFPQLDSIKSATVIFPEAPAAPAPATKKAAPPATKTGAPAAPATKKAAEPAKKQ